MVSVQILTISCGFLRVRAVDMIQSCYMNAVLVIEEGYKVLIDPNDSFLYHSLES